MFPLLLFCFYKNSSIFPTVSKLEKLRPKHVLPPQSRGHKSPLPSSAGISHAAQREPALKKLFRKKKFPRRQAPPPSSSGTHSTRSPGWH
ncbi:MAG: hypothetical protein PUJ93_05445, partial [Oscillospiraceae bacterium]|nr:hypothetical protein [Oscillospiraceae bacterium]MDY5736386.1 hypothetical protein [Oscillospiraceae bacterium]